MIERAGWLQILTPSLKHGGLNEVIHSEIAEEEAEAVIDRTIAEYDEHGLRFRWRITPDSRPLDMTERLERRGFLRATLRAMARSTEQDRPEDASIRIREVGPDDVHLFTRVIGEGWNMDPGPLDAFHRTLLAAPERRHHMFVAFFEDQLAGASNMAMMPRSMFLQGGVVLHDFRNRGVYGALVARRLRFAAERGIALATVHASAETSAPILARAGFEDVCTLSMFTNR